MPIAKAPISVVVPCYNCKETIDESITSILRQTLQPAEILLVDDASRDGTLDVLCSYASMHPDMVRVIELTENAGPGVARNAGWNAAKHPWIAFLDADDLWHSQKLEIQWNWLALNPLFVLCGHKSQLIDESINSDPVFYGSSPLTLRGMLISNKLPTRSVMLRKDIPLRFGDRSLTEDYLLWLKIIASNLPSVYLDVCLAYSGRPDFSPGGYSGQLWTHEKRELKAISQLRSEGYLGWASTQLVKLWSLLKFVRRLWISWRLS
jgi:glycosyltransferase involved in cell wall biosynthesis